MPRTIPDMSYCRAGRHRRDAALRTGHGLRGLRLRPGRRAGPLVRRRRLRAGRRAGRPVPAGARPRPRPARARRHGDRPRLGRRRRGPARRPGRRGARGPRGGRARGLPVHRRVRAGRRRTAGRAGARPRTGRTPESWPPAIPACEVDPDVLYVDNGSVLTSAGKAAAMDLCLHLVRLDHGSAIANTVARRLVVPPAPGRRPGPVRHHPGARPGRPSARRTVPLGDRAARPSADRGGPGPPGAA